jgi:predicted nucleic acid-binding protein
MSSSTQSSYSFVVDTNILIDFVIGLARAEKNPEEALRAEFAQKLILLSDCNLLFPEIVVKVEFPRVFSRLILERHITSENKIKVCVHILKYIEEALRDAGHGIVSTWTVKVLKTAAGWYARICSQGSCDPQLLDGIKRRHQDLLVLATARVYKAILITRDEDFVKIREMINQVMPLCLMKIKDSKLSCECIDTGQPNCIRELCPES